MLAETMEKITASFFAAGCSRGYLLALKDVLAYLEAHAGEAIEVAKIAACIEKLNKGACEGHALAAR